MKVLSQMHLLPLPPPQLESLCTVKTFREAHPSTIASLEAATPRGNEAVAANAF